MATVAVVGDGASGALAAIALLRHPAPGPRRIVVLGDAASLGDGVAYRTRSSAHLLNVRAQGMSALPDKPSDFVDFARREGLANTGTEFLPRSAYGAYLRDTLARAESVAPPGTSFEHQPTRVTDLRTAGGTEAWVVHGGDGTEFAADVVVLATGHRVVRPAWLIDDASVVVDPWAPPSIEQLAGPGSILIVGSGLTAVDAALSLRDAGHQGSIVLVSSHGLLPAAHLDDALPPREPATYPDDARTATLSGLIRALRADAWDARDWRQTIDGLRPVTVGLWRKLGPAEQRRALRHVSRRWDVLRHRMAPEVARTIDSLRATGQLRLERGRVVGVDRLDGRLRATLVDRGRARVLATDGVILCTGPTSDPHADPLLARLFARGIARPHPLRIGLDVDGGGRLRRPDGQVWPTLHAMGSLRKGAEWEATAIPELRLHAQGLADAILDPH